MALILTKAGLAALADAEQSGTKIQATHMAVGDGNGTVPEHTASAIGLENEVWRGPLQSIEINEQGETDAGKQVVFTIHIPMTAGGWYIREAALYADNTLLAIGPHPVMWKPAPDEPTKMEHVIQAPVTFGNAETVSLIIDPTVVLASQQMVLDEVAKVKALHEAHVADKGDPHQIAWNQIDNIPTTFPAASHGHAPADVGLGNLPNAKSDSVTSTNSNCLATSKAVKTAYDKSVEALDAANAKAPADHGHNQYVRSDVADTVNGEKTFTSQVTIENTVPMLRFNDTSPSNAGFWLLGNSDSFHIMTDWDGSGSYSGPYPLVLSNEAKAGSLYGNKIWTAGNDGAGSGLDADTLRGIAPQDSTADDTAGCLMRTGAFGIGSSEQAPTVLDLDDANVPGGIWQISAVTVGQPAGLRGTALVMRDWGGCATYLAFGRDDSGVFYRAVGSSGGSPTVSEWRKIWTESNDGAGSGLDADTLDGWDRDAIRDWDNLLNKPTLFDGSVSVKGTRTTDGTWTLSGLTVGKPIIIGLKLESGTDTSAISIRVISGADIGYANDNRKYIIDPEDSVPSFATVPAAATVSFAVLSMKTGYKLYAYQ